MKQLADFVVIASALFILWATYNASLVPVPHSNPLTVDWSDAWLQWKADTGEPAWQPPMELLEAEEQPPVVHRLPPVEPELKQPAELWKRESYRQPPPVRRRLVPIKPKPKAKPQPQGPLIYA